MSEERTPQTPGPWFAIFEDDETDRCEGVVNKVAYERQRAAEVNHDWSQQADEIITTDSGCYGPRRADALLIQAAPEMLEEIDYAWSQLNNYLHSGIADLRMVRDRLAAIRKKARSGQ